MNRNSFDCLTRAHQVLDDVERRQPREWVAIDDALGWPKESLPHFVASDPAAGIADPEVERDLVTKLLLNFGPPAGGPRDAPEPRA